MEKQTTCFFTGHRDVPRDAYDNIYNETKERIKVLAQNGYTDFICGGAIGFDTLAANAVLEMRNEYDIKLHLFLPCADQTKYFSDGQKAEYERIKAECDSVNVLYDKYFRGCMHARNRKMADESQSCIAFLQTESGGTAYTVSYAKKLGIDIYFVNR